MQQTQQQLIKVNGIQLSVHIAGPESGKTVWLLHGFPECWYSWRHQITALAAQGYRVFAPEMRGYGATEAPEAVEAYDLITICGDIQGAMNHFGHEQVAMIGHDWGAPIAWHLALLEPARGCQLTVSRSLNSATRCMRRGQLAGSSCSRSASQRAPSSACLPATQRSASQRRRDL